MDTPLSTASGAPHTLEKTLPSSYYLDPAIFKLERDRIFFRDWICVGRDEEVPPAGQTLTLDVLGESVILTRQTDGSLRAFYNVCRHRGARLCESHAARTVAPVNGGTASRPVLRCPYHSWSYDLNGALVAAPHMQDGEDFERAQFSLHPVGIDVWGGFVFLNMTPAEAPTLAEQLGPIPARIARYPLAELRIGHTIRYDVAANWKVIVENYNECYHCAGVHPELCDVVPAFRHKGGSGLDWDRGVPHKDGAWTYTFSGTTNRQPFPTLNDDEKVRHKGELIYPNVMLSLSCEHAAAFILRPIATDRTEITCHFLFAADEMAKPDFDPMDAVEFWDITNKQDWVICERVQQGMGSRVHEFGYYAPMEDLNLDIRRYIETKIGPFLKA
jgi:Rieske 2Fe-2S family protein